MNVTAKYIFEVSFKLRANERAREGERRESERLIEGRREKEEKRKGTEGGEIVMANVVLGS